MKSYEVIRSIVMRHSQYDAARILTLNLATWIAEESKHEERAVLARLADCIRTLCDAVTGMMKEDKSGCSVGIVGVRRSWRPMMPHIARARNQKQDAPATYSHPGR
jgi:hypothetical protein